MLVLLYTFKNTSFLVRAISSVAFLFFFYAVDHYFNIHFKAHHYVFAFIMAIVGFLLSPFYFIYPSFDKIQHVIFPFMFSSIVFHMVSRLNLKVKWELLFTSFIVLGSLMLFELGEYGLDYFFDLKLQGVFLRSLSGLEKYQILLDRIDDTMIDLMLGIVGNALYVGWHIITIASRHGAAALGRRRSTLPPHERPSLIRRP